MQATILKKCSVVVTAGFFQCQNSESTDNEDQFTNTKDRWPAPTPARIICSIHRLDIRFYLFFPVRLVSSCTDFSRCTVPENLHINSRHNGLWHIPRSTKRIQRGPNNSTSIFFKLQFLAQTVKVIVKKHLIFKVLPSLLQCF